VMQHERAMRRQQERTDASHGCRARQLCFLCHSASVFRKTVSLWT